MELPDELPLELPPLEEPPELPPLPDPLPEDPGGHGLALDELPEPEEPIPGVQSVLLPPDPRLPDEEPPPLPLPDEESPIPPPED